MSVSTTSISFLDVAGVGFFHVGKGFRLAAIAGGSDYVLKGDGFEGFQRPEQDTPLCRLHRELGSRGPVVGIPDRSGQSDLPLRRQLRGFHGETDTSGKTKARQA